MSEIEFVKTYCKPSDVIWYWIDSEWIAFKNKSINEVFSKYGDDILICVEHHTERGVREVCDVRD